jgi:hypothetical protein
MSERADEKDGIPFLTIMSVDLEKDVPIVKRVLAQLEERIHSKGAFRISDKAEMAAGWWFYDILATQSGLQKLFRLLLPAETRGKKSAANRIAEVFQEQLRSNSSEARVKMHGDIPFAAPWWAWLMR